MNWTDIQQWEAAPLQTYAAECDSNQRKLQSVGEALASPLNSLTGSGQTVKAAKAALRKQITAIEKEVNFLISSAEIASEGAQGHQRSSRERRRRKAAGTVLEYDY